MRAELPASKSDFSYSSGSKPRKTVSLSLKVSAGALEVTAGFEADGFLEEAFCSFLELLLSLFSGAEEAWIELTASTEDMFEEVSATSPHPAIVNNIPTDTTHIIQH